MPLLQYPYSLLLVNGALTPYVQAQNSPSSEPIRENHAISIWMPSASIPLPNAESPRPCLLKSARTIVFVLNTLGYFDFKDQTIKWVNEQLQQPGQGTSDVTMGVIIYLMTWEIARGNLTEVTHHMRGLQRMIDLRGGIPSARHFDWKLQFIDLLVAVMTSSEPRLHFQSRSPEPASPDDPSIGSQQVPDSPLWGTTPLSLVLANSPFCGECIKVLQVMRDLVTIRQSGRHDSLPLPSFGLLRHSSLPSLLKIILLTAIIFHRAFSEPPVSFAAPVNHDVIEQICRELEDEANDETWVRYPGILLWIVLTAGAAASFREERAFFTMFLMKVGTSAVWWGPDKARLALLRFLWIKRRSEGLEARPGVAD
ncbi:hypothetical protein D0Z07_4302 [Hyphodiscus hymeniophilus]|uniref:Uncharacterized protein n=1 Tax=Hyphodiscus hymeniophilus TaxID=353542 RepID=A0A9P6VJH9_9HELO|nr:hypothetical protein D0Z07_4302 [Hyphodiscus hymeniophilus]